MYGISRKCWVGVTWLMFASCGSEPATTSVPSQPGWLAMARSTDASTAVRTLTHDSLDFATDLYGVLAERPGNVVFSPHAVNCALAMVQLGARGATAEQLAHALHFNLPTAELPMAFAALRKALLQQPEADPDRLQLLQASAVWGAEGLRALPAYQSGLSLAFASGWHTVPFANNPEEVRQRINGWVAEQTDNHISQLLDPHGVSSATKLMVTTALYMAAPWARPFSRRAVEVKTFRGANGSLTEATMMTQSVQAAYGTTDDYQAVELPYHGGSLTFTLILPRRSLLEVSRPLDGAVVRELLAALVPRKVRLSLPKFKAESAYGLQDALARLGVHDAFSAGAANFSGIDGASDLFLSEIIHKTTIDVNEAGTHAAAAVAVGMYPTSVIVDTEWLEADHPFIFLIRDTSSGALLFMGRVEQPST